MAKTLVFNILVGCFLGTLGSLPNAFAYTFKEINKPISAATILKESGAMGLNISNIEAGEKQDLKTWPDKKVQTHLDKVSPEPLLVEVHSSIRDIPKAKVIAKHQLFRAVQKNWDRIKDSSLNEFAVDSFTKFTPYLVRELNRIEYTNVGGDKGYLFMLPWGDIRVDSKLKKVSYIIRIGSHLDGNRLEAGAEKIVIPERVEN